MDKTVLIQKQIRDNADELHSFMRDLSNWEKEMKRKETVVESGTIQTVPPIRKKTKTAPAQNTVETVAKSPTATENKPRKISGYDYRAWDKLDVRTASQLIKFWDNEKTKRKRILANTKHKPATSYFDSMGPQFSGIENADINVFLETSVDTPMKTLPSVHNFSTDSDEIKPFEFGAHNGFDKELERNINEMSVATCKGPPVLEYDPTTKNNVSHSENGDCPSYSSASYSGSHHQSANQNDSAYEQKRASILRNEAEKKELESKIHQERLELQKLHEEEMNSLRLEEMKVKLELAKKELELKGMHIELETKKIESFMEKEKYEREKEAIELEILRKKLS